MKTSILTVIFILTICFATKANQDCIWTSSKSGLTIHLEASCDFKNQILLDSIVNKAILLLNRQDTSLKILVFVSHRRLFFPNEEFTNFFSIAYDTLRQIDVDYIFNYYWNQEGISTSKNSGINTFESKKAPLDINSTNRKSTKEVGIKIFYDKDYRLGSLNWADIVKAIVYAAKNADRIKKEQVRDTVRYYTNDWYVSLVMLDTLSIKKILGKEPAKNLKKKNVVANTNNFYFVIAGIGLLFITVLFLVRRKHNR